MIKPLTIPPTIRTHVPVHVMQIDLIAKEQRSAVFSECRSYRYTLTIVWDPQQPLCQFIGLNPSTADEIKDDPTIRRCKDFARTWGCGGLVMTNLFAFRATLPKVMKAHPQPIGEPLPEGTNPHIQNYNWNDYHLLNCWNRSSIVVAAWGKDGNYLDRAAAVTNWIKGMKCLGKNGDGTPKHPLYIAKSTQLIDFP